MFHLQTVFLGLALSVGACPALACTPPPEQANSVPVPFSATVDSAYARALTVATVKVLRVERIVPSADAQEGWSEKAIVEPKRIFKGRNKSIPKFFNTGFSGTTCDTASRFVAGVDALVFLSSLDEPMLMVPATDTARYEQALRLLEHLRR